MAMYSERVLRWLKLCIELFDKLVKCFLLCLRFLGISPVLVGILLWCDEINVLNYTSHGLLLLATIPIVVVIEDDLRERTVAKRAVHHLGPIIVSYAVRRINQFSPWLFLLIWSTVLLALVPATLRSGRRILADELSTELTFSAFSALIWGVCQSLALFAHIENIMRHIFVLALLFVVDYRRNWRTLLLLVLLGFYQSFTISNVRISTVT